MELSLGQFISLGPVAVWKVSPLFKGTMHLLLNSFRKFSLYFTSSLHLISKLNSFICVAATEVQRHKIIICQTMNRLNFTAKNIPNIKEYQLSQISGVGLSMVVISCILAVKNYIKHVIKYVICIYHRYTTI